MMANMNTRPIAIVCILAGATEMLFRQEALLPHIEYAQVPSEALMPGPTPIVGSSVMPSGGQFLIFNSSANPEAPTLVLPQIPLRRI
jgi:hypothetical protein